MNDRIKIPAALKITCVVLVCIQVTYMNYILFNYYFPALKIKHTNMFIIGPYLYAAVVFFFAQHYLKERNYLKLAVWIVLNCSLSYNAYLRFHGHEPSILLQYSQSTSLLIYALVMLYSKALKPNWEKIFAISCFTILIPCLIFYFTEQWALYELLVYALGFTPIINAFVFLPPSQLQQEEILDLE